MAKITPNDNIKTMSQIMPVIYAASIPYDVRWMNGWLKIGEARRQSATDRLAQEGHEIDSDLKLLWERNALFEGNPVAFFRDKDFHRYLKNEGIECAKRRSSDNDMEVFKIGSKEALNMLNDFRANRGLAEIEGAQDYTLRKEQREAVEKALAYAKEHPSGEFLFNAKPRFGKTLAAYDLARKLKAKTVLIVTNRPAIANSWYDDYIKFVGTGYADSEDSMGYFFVSGTSALKGAKGVHSYDEYKADTDRRINRDHIEPMNMIYFLSLQDLKGSKYFSADGYDKLREVSVIDWDMLVIDEAHEGVDTYKTDTAFTHIKRKFTLHLSGTPFKALSNEKFKSDAIFNWTYADEQKRKAEFADMADNPYAELPKLNMYTYKMSEIVAEKLQQGIEIQGETEEYAFDLGEFFKTREMSNGAVSFVYNDSVDLFLNALTYKDKYPFSTEKLRNELKHTLWLLDRVNSAKALARKLEAHPVFKDYKIIVAAGDGRLEEDDSTVMNAYKTVTDAIANYDKTITLSVGQLTTGVTIPEWTAVLMLSNINSPALYMQAAFRAQNPCTITTGELGETGEPVVKTKENSYVFDFDPARTLTVFEKFANNLSPSTASGGGTLEQRQQNIRELLNFFPVIGEDENGSLVELNVEQVLTIPRKIRSQEVVRRGFMSNFLFNISNVFNIPKAAMDIINTLTPVKEQKNTSKRTEILIAANDGFAVDDDGNVTATDDHVQETVDRIFGDKKYGSVTEEDITGLVDDSAESDATDNLISTLTGFFEDKAEGIIEDTKEDYGDDMRKSDTNQLSSQFKARAAKEAHDIATDNRIKQNIIEKERDEAIEQIVESIDTAGKTEQEIEAEVEKAQEVINAEYEKKKSDLKEDMKRKIADALDTFEQESKASASKTMEEKKEQRRADSIMDDIRDRLRSFSRTIPSFIMAYSDNEKGEPTDITLQTFDDIVPDDVFREVTSITLDQFRQLRDGFDYKDETGAPRHFDGNLFDQVVFDDAVGEFISIKKRLANYFDEKQHEDIFDYIPPQRTNQIYTPKKVVQQMVDYLEEENPGCFDDPEKTFIDLYMKSGLYITEIVKRLYRSPKMISAFPDDTERLQHIFDKQVYGLAPTKIIFAIATNFIMGFARQSGISINTSHFKELDALPYAQGAMDMTLEEKLDELFGKDGD